MPGYSIEPRTKKYVKGYRFLSFPTKYGKQLLDTELHAFKTASRKVVHKAAEVAGEVLGSKIAYEIGKPKYVTDENPRNFEKIAILLEKKRRNIKQK